VADYSFDLDREPLPHSIPGTGISLRAPGLRGRVSYTDKSAPAGALGKLRETAVFTDELDRAVNETSTLHLKNRDLPFVVRVLGRRDESARPVTN
jgi:hypothetical protein